MKTTYVPKSNSIQSNTSPNVNSNKPESISLVDTYKEVVEVKNIKEEVELAKYQEAINESSNEEVLRAQYAQELAKKNKKQESVQPKVKQKKKKSKKPTIIVISVIVILAILGCVGAFYLYSSSSPSVNELSEKVDSLYTSDSKVDIVDSITQSDLDAIYIEVQGIKNNQDSVSELTKELDTIGYFIQDKEILNKFDSADCSLTDSNLTLEVSEVKNNTSLYSVQGLATTNSERATSILTAYDDFINLRLELQGITDVQSFDESIYTDKINNVTHTLNKQELQGIVATINADKDVLNAQAKLDSATNEDEKATAQKELENAQEVQKQTQQQLEEIQKKLEASSNTSESSSQLEEDIAPTEDK